MNGAAAQTEGAPLRFEERVALVTGAASGLGAAYCRALAVRGAKLVVNDLPGSEEQFDGLTRFARSMSSDVHVVTGDISDPATARELVAAAAATFGRVDIVISNAGQLEASSFIDTTYEAIQRHLAVHLGGPFHLLSAAWPHLLKQQYGRVVMTVSNAALYGLAGSVAYASAKGAVLGFARCLAQEATGSGIRVNSIAPGALTGMSAAAVGGEALERMRRSMPPDAVVPALLWLAHERCDVSGAVIDARGGAFRSAFTGLTEGWRGGVDCSPERLIANIDTVFDMSTFNVPSDNNQASALLASYFAEQG